MSEKSKAAELTQEQMDETLERVIKAWPKLTEFQMGQIDMLAQIMGGEFNASSNR